MELKIIKEKENPSLLRVEIEAEVEFFNEATPKKEDIKKKIASLKKTDEKVVVVKNINSSFGVGNASVLVYVYKSEKELTDVEPKKKEKKGAKPEGDAPAEEAKAALKEEAPKAEEKKE